MKKNTSEQDVLNLLSGIKNTESEYPQDLIRSRRDLFTKQAAAMAVLAKAGVAGKSASTTGSGSATTGVAGATASSFGTLLETALVIAIIVEAGTATYIYRDKIANFIRSNLLPKSSIVSNPPVSSPSIIFNETPNPSETVTVTETDTITAPVLVLPAGDNTNPGGGSGSSAASTPAPTEKGGLHLGQTKQPTNSPQDNKAPQQNKSGNQN